MTDWAKNLVGLQGNGETSVLITVAETKGSAPREAGVKMIVAKHDIYGSIGGGNLEFTSIAIARQLLWEASDATIRGFFRSFPLGPGLGQCCGGRVVLLFELVDSVAKCWLDELIRRNRNKEETVLVTLLQNETIRKILLTKESANLEDLQFAGQINNSSEFQRIFSQIGTDNFVLKNFPAKSGEPVCFVERIAIRDFSVVIFGAGHVGRALVRVLADTPCDITWIDSREYAFSDSVPDNVTVVCDEQPEFEVEVAPPGSYYLVMTHSHTLDGRICERILKRHDHAWCGLIGSRRKRRKFEKRFRQAGISEQEIESLVCPVGIAGISGKQPEVIAIAVAAQVLAHREAPHAATNGRCVTGPADCEPAVLELR